MVRINNLFFIYVLVCLGFGLGRTYWNENYSQYLFIGVSTLIVGFLTFSKKFYTKESHRFFFKQAFMTTLITILCGFITSESRAFKALDIAFYHVWLGALTFWVFTIFQFRDNRDERNNQGNLNQNSGNTTLAW